MTSANRFSEGCEARMSGAFMIPSPRPVMLSCTSTLRNVLPLQLDHPFQTTPPILHSGINRRNAKHARTNLKLTHHHRPQVQHSNANLLVHRGAALTGQWDTFDLSTNEKFTPDTLDLYGAWKAKRSRARRVAVASPAVNAWSGAPSPAL